MTAVAEHRRIRYLADRYDGRALVDELYRQVQHLNGTVRVVNHNKVECPYNYFTDIGDWDVMDNFDGLMADRAGTSRRRIQRWKNGTTLSERDADMFAVRIGLHPALIWPDWWAKAPDVTD